MKSTGTSTYIMNYWIPALVAKPLNSTLPLHILKYIKVKYIIKYIIIIIPCIMFKFTAPLSLIFGCFCLHLCVRTNHNNLNFSYAFTFALGLTEN